MSEPLEKSELAARAMVAKQGIGILVARANVAGHDDTFLDQVIAAKDTGAIADLFAPKESNPE